MKRIAKFLPLLFVAFFSVGLTSSCDYDDDWYKDRWYGDWDKESWWNSNYANPSDDLVLMAQTLRGHWSGKTAARFYDDNNILREEVYDTDIEFDQYKANALFGRGRQLDYYGNELVYDRTFTWHIDTHTADIYVVYDGEGNNKFQMVIRYDDLLLDQHRFDGVMIGQGETDEFTYQRYTFAKQFTGDTQF